LLRLSYANYSTDRLSGYSLKQVDAPAAWSSAAADYAGVSVYHLMNELTKRDIAPPAAAEKFVDGLKTLMVTFGGSEALRQTIVNRETEA
jgi:hypothetical protein